MGLEQKIENIIGRLDILVPAIQRYENKVDLTSTDLAVLKQKVDSEVAGIRGELTSLKLAVATEATSPGERRARVWDIVVLVVAAAVSALTAMLVRRG